MKTADSCFPSRRVKSLVYIGLIGLGLIAVSKGQSKNEKDYIIRLGVEEVRLDAVVLDKKGRQITDLTVDDFEIRQGGIDQKLSSAIYINEYQPRPRFSPKKEAIPFGAYSNSHVDPRRKPTGHLCLLWKISIWISFNFATLAQP